MTTVAVLRASWIVLALAFAGCGEASPADTAATEATDGGASTAYAAVLAVPTCPELGPLDVTACDPSTSFTVDTGIPVVYSDGVDAGAINYQAKVSYYACSYQYTGPVQSPQAGGPVTAECMAGATVLDIVGNTATPVTSTSHQWKIWTIGYCVPTCPAAK